MALDFLSGGLIGLLVGMLVVAVIIGIGLYVYLSLAFMTIGKKAKLTSPGLAWIPGIGPLIISFQAAKMHWWPWLLLVGAFIPVIGFLFSLTFMVFTVIWKWKMFETIERPGWWAIMQLIPIVGLIFLGIAAWGNSKR